MSISFLRASSRSPRKWVSGMTQSFSSGAASDLKSEEYCIDLVKSKDYEGYLSASLFPKDHRRAFFAVRAYNIEIATIRDQVPKAAQQAGRMRFQFWRDALTSLSESKKLQAFMRQPVAYELQYLVSKYDINVRWLERSLEARYSDLTKNSTYENYDDLENYAEFGHSSLLYVLLEVLKVKDENIQFAASHIGVSSGLATLIRGHAYHASQGMNYMPKDVMKKFQLREGAAVRDNNSNENERKMVQDVIHDMASQAYAQLDAGRQKFNACDRSIRAAALPAFYPAGVSVDVYLQRLQKEANFDPFLMARLEGAQEFNPLPLQLKMLSANFTKSL